LGLCMTPYSSTNTNDTQLSCVFEKKKKNLYLYTCLLYQLFSTKMASNEKKIMNFKVVDLVKLHEFCVFCPYLISYEKTVIFKTLSHTKKSFHHLNRR